MENEILGIIPARGGSKGIPRKNIKDFGGHPLIAYSIAAGLKSHYITRLIVSTDDEEIADVATDYGAEIPFIRPGIFAQDDTLDLPVFQHALNHLWEKERYRPEMVVHLRPTSPIRPAHLVDAAIQILYLNKDADSVRGLVPAGQNPFKMWIVQSNGRIQPLVHAKGVEESYNAPRQVLPYVYWHTGIIDVIRPNVILTQDSMSGSVIMPAFVDPAFSVDIDSHQDWIKAEELLYRLPQNEIVCPYREEVIFND